MRFAERLSRWADLIGAGVFAVLFLSLVVQVVRRFVFGAPAAWTEELAAIAFVWVIFWGTAFTVPLSAHVAVDFVAPRFAPLVRRALYALGLAALAACFLWALPGTADYLRFMMRERTPVLDWPYGAVYGVFVVIALLRGPIGLAMIAGGIAYLGATGQDMGLAAEQILNSLFGSFVLIAVPMFIFAANVMNSGTLSERIYALAHAIMGRFRGGLAHVNVLASVIFSGMSGSAIADAVGPGMVEIEMMCRNGRYSRPFAVAVSAASATIGPIIPPSIPMVLYALVSGASVGALFIGGIVPGLLMAAAMMLVIVWIGRRRNFPMEAPVPWSELPRIFVRTLLPLLMPVVLLGGIYSGVFTPTEAAAVAALYALVLALFVYRALDWKGLVSVLADTARSTAVVGIIICGAFLFNYVLATEQIPGRVAEWFAALGLGPLGFLLVANLVFLVLGCLLDTTTLLLVLVPLLLPVARAVGVDLVHFGVVIVLNMMIGLLTPPYGVLLFVLSGLAGTPVKEIVRELVPFILALIAVLFLITFVPSLVLALPVLAGYLR